MNNVTHLSDAKWDMVKTHYEQSYHIRFKCRPTDDQIEWLYDQMKQLGLTEFRYKKKMEETETS